MKPCKRVKGRNSFEQRIIAELTAKGIDFGYETEVIKYEQPAKDRSYTPDIILKVGRKKIYVELKGYFSREDRSKHLWIKESNPKLDIRFVFYNASNRISKKSKTTYSKWCDDKGFIWADKSIPEEWLK